MATLREAEFRKAIEQGTLSGAYLLYGAEKYTMLQTIRKLKKKVNQSGMGDFNLQEFDGTSVSMDTVAASAEALPCFAEKRYLLVSDWNMDPLSAGEQGACLQLLQDLPESTVLVLYLPTIQLEKRLSAKWKKLFAVQTLTTVEFPRKTAAELEKFLMAFAEKRNCVLSRDLAKKIVSDCGVDLERLCNEMEKLCAYADSSPITMEQIKTVMIPTQEAQIFELSKQLIAGEYTKAYQIVHRLLEQREEPISIVAMLSSAYLNLYRAKCMISSKKNVSELSASFDYRNKEFLLRSAERDCSRFSVTVLQNSLLLLQEADLALKGGAGSSREEMKIVILDELITKLLIAAQQ